MIHIKDIPLQQWLCRVQSAAYSEGAPENRERFQNLASSIGFLETAPSRYREEVQAVIVTVQTINESEIYFGTARLFQMAQEALCSLKKPSSR